MGFFYGMEKASGTGIPEGAPNCSLCRLHKRPGTRNPRMFVDGEGKRGILLVGESPRRDDDRSGRLFCSKEYDALKSALGRSVDLRRDCWMMNSVACFTGIGVDPTQQQMDFCAPALSNFIRENRPRLIIPMGKHGIKQVIELLWDGGFGNGFLWVGRAIPSIDWNAWICPVTDVCYTERKMEAGSVEAALLKRHLEASLALRGRPWQDGPPDYRKFVRCVYDSSEAASEVERMASSGRFVAFDYESDRLKPDHPEARLVSCSVSDGESAVSFPWTGDAIRAVRDLLWSEVPKVGWNIKHEERWTRREFGRGVRNWAWDGMLAEHAVDNRRGSSGLKFQAFVRLGVRNYGSDVSKFLEADCGNDRNRIRDADLRRLLLYGGMDSLCTWKICAQQMGELGHVEGEGDDA